MKRMTRAYGIVASTLIALSLVAGQAFAGPRQLHIDVFIHQDVAEPANSVHENYFSHWEKEIREISGRDVTFEYFTEPSDITLMDYQSDDLDSVLQEIRRLHATHRDEYSKAGYGALRKGILITAHPINSSTWGLASDKGHAGIASLKTYSSAAHELGHMLGATHDNAKGGWTSFCDSYMVAGRNPIKAQCYAYSEANREMIADHLRRQP